MREIWEVELGQVTTRKGAKLHLNVNGQAYCRSGSSKIIASHKASYADTPRICKKCREALRTFLQEVRDARARRVPTAANREVMLTCEAILAGLRSPAEQAQHDEMVANINRNMDRAYAPVARPRTAVPAGDSQSLF